MRRIELRKERDTVFKHEYLLVYLHDDVVFCLERRADPSALTNIVLPSGTDASDIIYNGTRERGKLEFLRQTSDNMIDLKFTPELDFLVLLLICHGIQTDDQGQTYTLQRFNCYFFARTAVAAMARHASISAWDSSLGSNNSMVITVVQPKVTERVDEKRSSNRLRRLIQKRSLSYLVDSLTAMLWRELFQGSLHLDVRMTLRKTLWRSNAEFAVGNAINDPIRLAVAEKKLEALRVEWVDEHHRRNGVKRKHLAAVWDAVWRGIWESIRREAEQKFPRGADWDAIWDRACSAPASPSDAATTPSSVLISFGGMEQSELQLQKHILKLMEDHGKDVNARGLGVSAFVYWEVQLATNRAWKKLVSVNPTFDIVHLQESVRAYTAAYGL